jgi:glycosyltransferase involved in cell wall biosynthesis
VRRIDSVLLVAASCDGTDVGEAWVGWQWTRHIARRARVTLLTQRRPGRTPPSRQLPGVEVIEFDEVTLPARLERLNAMAKPGYPFFRRRAERWIAGARASGRNWDVAHQLTPVALRYASPLARFDIPYVLGPLAGSLETPAAFRTECASAPPWTRLRALDGLRISHDPVLRASWRRASAVLAVAPYVEALLADVGIRRFEIISELGIDALAPERQRPAVPGRLRLVHVGRAVRTKGLRDAVRAFARLPAEVDAELDVAGAGEELELCRVLAAELGVADRIRFHGRLPRAEVEALYAQADAFLFPSFREPSGSVVFEALRHGLPVITVDRGGPGEVVDETCGLRVPAENPQQLAEDLARAITRLARDPGLRCRLAHGARARMERIGLWKAKTDWLFDLYGSLEPPLTHGAEAAQEITA